MAVTEKKGTQRVAPTEVAHKVKHLEEKLKTKEFAFPPACVYDETPTSYVISFYAPNLEPEDLDVEIADNILVVRGEHRKERTAEKSFHCYCEEFQKNFLIGEPIDEDGVELEHNEGLFALFLPKA